MHLDWPLGLPARKTLDTRAKLIGALFACLVAAQIASPLLESVLAPLTIVIVVILTSITFLLGSYTTRPSALVAVLIVTTSIAIVAEAIGIRTGIPFGDYHYTGALHPQVLDVPIVIPLAWFAMGLPAWEISRRLVPRQGPVQWTVGGLVLAAWDLLLDPQMVANGFWTWHTEGPYFGIPLSNYIGWTLIGTFICFACSHILRHPEGTAPNPGLTLLYAWMGFFTTLGFLLPFVFNRPLVGVIGGLGMLLPAVFALRTYSSPWPR